MRGVGAVREPVYSIEHTAEQVTVTVHMPGVNGVAQVELDLCDGCLFVEAGLLKLKLQLSKVALMLCALIVRTA